MQKSKKILRVLLLVGFIGGTWLLWQHMETFFVAMIYVYKISILGMLWLAYEGWKSKRFYQRKNEIS